MVRSTCHTLLGTLQKGPTVADTVIGEGNTSEWKMCGLDKSTCLTVFFDISATDKSSTPKRELYIQFLTRYVRMFCPSAICSYFRVWACSKQFEFYLKHLVCSYQNPEGKTLCQVTTVCRQWVDTASTEVSTFSLYFLNWVVILEYGSLKSLSWWVRMVNNIMVCLVTVLLELS